MDAELRERFDKSDEKQDNILAALNDHLLQSAVRHKDHEAGVRANSITIHEHMEDHKEKRRWFWGLWAGMLVALGGAVWNFFAGRK